MGIRRGPNIVTDGLVFAVDAANPSSYVSGSGIWKDQTVNQNDGTLTNNPTFDSGNGGSIAFDGSNDYIDNDNVLSQVLNNTNGTISSWIKLDDATLSSLQEIISFNDTTSNGRIEVAIEVTTGQSRGYCYTAGSQRWWIKTDAAATTDDTWVNVTLTQNGSLAILYVNGVVVPQSTAGAQPNPGYWFSNSSLLDNVRIGCRNINNGGNTRFINGNIANTHIYNRALSATEVAQNYNALKGRFGL